MGAERDFLSSHCVPGVVLFARNCALNTAGSWCTPIEELQSLGPELPYLIAVDQEGGRVRRLRASFPDLGPSLHACGGGDGRQDLLCLREYGWRVAMTLKMLGFNVNFAPSVDILSNPANTGIGDRAFGLDPAAVEKRAGAFLAGLQSVAGVFGCLKHFPGQGSELADAHYGSVVVNHSRKRLNDRELRPYRRMLTHCNLVMVSHCTYSALEDKPASISRVVIGEILQRQLEYTGVVVSDDFNMHAIAQSQSLWGRAIVDAVAAGIDLLLICSGDLQHWRFAIDVLESRARHDSSFARRLEDAAQKVRSLRSRLS